MVLVQVEDGIEHLIYYLNRNLNDTKVKYSYAENLALETIQLFKDFATISYSEKLLSF